MRRLPLIVLQITLILLSAVSFLLPAESAALERIRKPVVAGMWYPSERRALLDMLAELDQRAAKSSLKLPHNKVLKALIMPHAGFIYSGWTAAHAGRLLEPEQFEKVILVGPDHRVGFRDGAISAVSAYQTPLGRVPLHRDAAIMRAESLYFRSNETSDRMEHSLEAVLPFLQYYLKSFQMIPVVVGAAHARSMARAIEPYLDADTLLVVSSDLSHYQTYDTARKRDTRTIRSILALDDALLAAEPDCACGRTPILVLMQIARQQAWQPILLHYSNSGDTGKDRSRVVGYAAIAFYGDPAMEKENQVNSDRRFTPQQGQALINLARQSITNQLEPSKSGLPGAANPQETCYRVRCGTFVTLRRAGRLRGCIGNFGDADTVYNGIRKNALKAAFADPRFPPLSTGETSDLKISVSILSTPHPLVYQDGTDLKLKLRPNVDGVIIRKGRASATFLPQVWQQLPRADDFLSQLCLKAGLDPDAWRHTPLEVLTYQVQYFEEK